MSPSNNQGAKHKLARVPHTHKIHKRPALRPAIPTPYTNSSSPKVLYIRAKTPWVSAVKRTQTLLRHISKRERSLHGPTDDEILAAGRVGGAKNAAFRTAHRNPIAADSGSSKSEEVYLKGTGKAIKRVLELGLWFQQQPEYCVRVTTGSKGVIDDIVHREADDVHVDGREAADGAQDEVTTMELTAPQVPDTRIRMLSIVTVAVGWK